MEYKEDDKLPEDIKHRGITQEMCDIMDTDVSVTAKKSLMAEEKIKVDLDNQKASVANLIAHIISRY